MANDTWPIWTRSRNTSATPSTLPNFNPALFLPLENITTLSLATKTIWDTKKEHTCVRKNKHSAAAWKAYPLTDEFGLSDDDVVFMLQYATRAPTPGLPKNCSCHATMSLEHAVHCDTAKLQRHNMLQHRLVAFAREQAVTTAQNVRLSLVEAKKKQEPDIIFYFRPKPLETDVTVVNPCAPSKLLQTLARADSAMQARCNVKNNKYRTRTGKRLCPTWVRNTWAIHQTGCGPPYQTRGQHAGQHRTRGLRHDP